MSAAGCALVRAGIAAWLLAGSQAQAQEGLSKFEDLRVPSSPAFVLMGIEPRTIERPRTPRAVGLSALQATNQIDKIPRNYAAEFAPYWLFPHPKLEYRPYERESIAAVLAQTLSLSVATSSDSAAGKTSVGAGIRALLARGGMPDSVPVLLDSLSRLQTQAADPNTPEEQEDELLAQAKQVALRLQQLSYSTGFRLEVAGAVMGSFDGDKYSTGRLARLGVWVTPSYQLARPKLDVSAVMRLIFNRGDRSGTNFDYGARLSYDFAALAVSYELVGRATFDATITTPGAGTFTLDNTYRSAGSVEYRLGAGRSVSFTFGRNFTETDEDKNLLASLSLNLGFGVIPLLAKKARDQ